MSTPEQERTKDALRIGMVVVAIALLAAAGWLAEHPRVLRALYPARPVESAPAWPVVSPPAWLAASARIAPPRRFLRRKTSRSSCSRARACSSTSSRAAPGSWSRRSSGRKRSSCFKWVTPWRSPSPISRWPARGSRARSRSARSLHDASFPGAPSTRWSGKTAEAWCGRRISPRRSPPRSQRSRQATPTELTSSPPRSHIDDSQ